jgi:hypothetical protein
VTRPAGRPPANGGTAANPPTQPDLALRLAVAPGDTMVRFNYRTVKLSTTSFSYGETWMLGSVGETPTAIALPAASGTTTTVAAGGMSWTLGPVSMASFPLPAGAASEVVLQRTFKLPASLCGRPSSGVDGIIIDDLRVE